jgi:flagellar biosynthesis/type III secretory pathway M-ring protein FliF/YscJ
VLIFGGRDGTEYLDTVDRIAVVKQVKLWVLYGALAVAVAIYVAALIFRSQGLFGEHISRNLGR